MVSKLNWEDLDDLEDTVANSRENIEDAATKVKDAAQAVQEAAEQLADERAEFEKEREEFEQARGTSPTTAIANSVGGGGSRDFVDAIQGRNGGGDNPVLGKSTTAGGVGPMKQNAVRVAKLHTGEVEPRNAQERRLANLEGEEKRKAMAMCAKELPDENGDRSFMREIKKARAE